MYPSGKWTGFWQQEHFGRQPMDQFELTFRPTGEVSGRGLDMVGLFTFKGTYDPTAGTVELVKQYIGKHQVRYVGHPDGEGRIVGTWSIAEVYTGPFSFQPVITSDMPIREWGT